MSYKTTLLREDKQLIEITKEEIRKILERNDHILNVLVPEAKNLVHLQSLLNHVEENLEMIELKEAEIKYLKEEIQEILTMENAA